MLTIKQQRENPLLVIDNTIKFQNENMSSDLNFHRNTKILTNKPRILMVEDDKIIRKCQAYFLEELGCEVVIAKTGKEALVSYKAQTFDLILLDVGLPDIQGTEISKDIRNQNKKIPIIFLTTHGVLYQDVCYQSGGNDFVTKPIGFIEFDHLLKKWLPQHQFNYEKD